VLGGPGAGKGTQCSNIASNFPLIHLSVGDLLRAERSNPASANYDRITKALGEGSLVPVSVSLDLVDATMNTYPPGSVFLIDGFPRNVDNRDGWVSKMGAVEILGVVVFDCGVETLKERILRRGETSGRTDDNAKALIRRFESFHEDTVPVINEMAQEMKERVVRINGERPKEEVWEETKQVIETLLKR
jgi:UMP-CMP kinase